MKHENITSFVKQVQKKEIDILEHTHKALDEIKKINKTHHYYNTLSEDLALQQAVALKKAKKITGKLAGVIVSVKDAICVKSVESTAGSRILKGYKPVFHATVIENIIREGGIIVGKTSQDGFGFGTFNLNVGLGMKVPLNPFDKERSTGGSSGGSCGITQKISVPHIALAESTGGSLVAPASFCGVVGLCPTYGRVSRYGLMDYANSLDKIGPVAKDPIGVARMLSVIAGFDERDSTSLQNPVESYTVKNNKPLKVGVIKDAFGEGVEEEVSTTVKCRLAELEQEKKIITKEITLPLTKKYGVETYYILAMSEASTNLAKYCGMRYGMHEPLEGSFNEYFTKVRSKHFNAESKRRIIIGTFARMAGFRDAYYLKAAKVRTKIIAEYKKAFSTFDLLVSPTMPVLPPKLKEVEKLTPLQHYMMDIMTVGPNLAGLPHMNFTAGFVKKLPVGMLCIADHLQEAKLLGLGA